MAWIAWQVVVYFGGIALLMLLAKLIPLFDRMFAVLVGVIVFLFAAFRQGGFDYQEYLLMAEVVRAASDASLLDIATSFAAKDPLFGLLVTLSSLFSDDVVFVIYAMALLGALTKTLFALSLRSNATLFMGLYAILLAPGLEFAAMRTGVALGLFALAMRWLPFSLPRIALLGTSVLAHISMVVPLLLAALANRISGTRSMVLVGFGMIGSLIFFTSLGLLPFARAEDYSDNVGTINAVFFPILSFLIFLFAFPAQVLEEGAARTIGPRIAPMYFFNIALLLLAIALGAALPAVTISVRVMELSWFVTLLAFLHIGFDNKPRRYWGGFLMFVVFLALMNVLRSTWVVFGDFQLLQF